MPIAPIQAQATGSLFLWLFVLLGLIILGGGTVLYLRRWYQQEDDVSPAGFTLGDLRDLHRSGQMTDEEFERAKAQIIASARRAAERDAQADHENDSPKLDVELKGRPDDDVDSRN